MQSKRENYLIINNKDSVYVVIDKDENNLIIAPVNFEKKLIKPEYSIINLKSNISNPLKLERKVVEGGLKVKTEN